MAVTYRVACYWTGGSKVYRKASTRTGGKSKEGTKLYPKRRVLHGDITIRMLGGKVIDPPIVLPGGTTVTEYCNRCRTYFSLKNTFIYVRLKEPVEHDGGLASLDRKFCTKECFANWLAESPKGLPLEIVILVDPLNVDNSMVLPIKQMN